MDEGDQVRRYRSIKMIRSNPTKSDPKNGPARTKAQAVGSKLARTSVDFGRARWMRGNAGRMNGKAKGLSDRNPCFIYDAEEGGLRLEENLRSNSPIFAYVRLCSLNGRKKVGPVRLISGAAALGLRWADRRCAGSERRLSRRDEMSAAENRLEFSNMLGAWQLSNFSL